MSEDSFRTHLHHLLGHVTVPPFDPGEPIERELPTTLKRRASPSFEGQGDNIRKRFREDVPPNAQPNSTEQPSTISGLALADDLEQELLCGCCSGILYKPVIVYPCQHYFCGR
jgi:E3 ubiquitin-protein ligase CHFR